MVGSNISKYPLASKYLNDVKARIAQADENAAAGTATSQADLSAQIARDQAAFDADVTRLGDAFCEKLNTDIANGTVSPNIGTPIHDVGGDFNKANNTVELGDDLLGDTNSSKVSVAGVLSQVIDHEINHAQQSQCADGTIDATNSGNLAIAGFTVQGATPAVFARQGQLDTQSTLAAATSPQTVTASANIANVAA